MCDCIVKINEQLKESGYKLDLDVALFYSKGHTWDCKVTPRIACIKDGTDGKRRRDYKFISGKFCPFCGERLIEEETK